ncbi:hypothetical protein RHMOL_Rhmol05G0279800 [Rhododendron molle]|uniref:Uncharacterized protein n=1 Tax=Rhododendron molle TaxID=49168 RepID=A0ACC0NUV5_RHOML|nr:hypothetical protein RHMOL_Rhmol05G0279800 [Rhododendron molle]
MEGKKQVGPASSSSSFTSDLFGEKESSVSSSSGIFGSIFSPSSKVLGRESLRSETIDKKQDSSSQAWNSTKPGPQDTISRSSEGENVSVPNRESSSPIYEEQRGQPCHLSSSLYYGGQDIYSHPQNTQPSSYPTTHQVNKDGDEDDSGSASRGNWWQGSHILLYRNSSFPCLLHCGRWMETNAGLLQKAVCCFLHQNLRTSISSQ